MWLPTFFDTAPPCWPSTDFALFHTKDTEKLQHTHFNVFVFLAYCLHEAGKVLDDVRLWVTEAAVSQADRVNQKSPGRDSECGYQRVRRRRDSLHRRNRPGECRRDDCFPSCLRCSLAEACFAISGTDGTDHEDSECPDPAGRCRAGKSRWDQVCSSGSLCSQSSDEDAKPMAHSRAELYPAGGDAREFPPRMCGLLRHSGPSASRGPPVDLGGPPYSGIHR